MRVSYKNALSNAYFCKLFFLKYPLLEYFEPNFVSIHQFSIKFSNFFTFYLQYLYYLLLTFWLLYAII